MLADFSQEFWAPVEIVKPDIDEKLIRSDDAQCLVVALAFAKAEAVRRRVTGSAIIITADQVVTSNGSILEKPVSLDEARLMLKSYRNNPPSAPVGIAVTNLVTGRQHVGFDASSANCSRITDEAIDAYLQDWETVRRCSGAITANHPTLRNLITFDQGTIDSFEGLPKDLTKLLIQRVLS